MKNPAGIIRSSLKQIIFSRNKAYSFKYNQSSKLTYSPTVIISNILYYFSSWIIRWLGELYCWYRVGWLSPWIQSTHPQSLFLVKKSIFIGTHHLLVLLYLERDSLELNLASGWTIMHLYLTKIYFLWVH